MTREEDVEPALEVEFGMLDYKSSIDSTEGIVSRVHAVAAAPMPPGSDFAFFDPKEPSCQTLLLSPSTTVSQLFAVLRQWVPQVQQHVALIGNEMLKRGCHPNDRDELTDMTLLHYTCKAGAPGIGDAEAAAAFAERLLALEANPSLRSRWTGMNALHYAAYFDVPEIIPVVLQAAGPKEVDATCSDFDFGTALHIAASNLCLSAAKSLLEHSANPLFKNNRGQVPCDVVPDAADMPLEMAEVALVAREIRRLLSRATAAPALLPTPPLPSQPTPPAPPGLTVGQRVIVGGRKTGVLRFCGPTEFAGDQWAGVELDEADGKNNGSVDGTRYFTCAPRHGIFAPLSKVARAEESSRHGSLNSSGAIRSAVPVSRIAARGSHADPCHDDAASRRTAGHTNMKPLSSPRRKVQASAFSSDASAENNSNKPQGSGSSSSGSSSPHLTRRRASVTLPLKPSRNAGAQPPRTKPAESRIQHGVRKRLPSSGSGGTSDGAAELELGERLLVSGQRAGVLRFQGTTHFAPGHWYGIELEQPSGRNDGSVAGVRYFQCPAKHGVFAPPSRVQRLTVSMESLLDLPTGKASHPLSAFQRSLSIPNTGKPPRKPLGRTPMSSRGKPGSLCRSLSHTAALSAANDAASPATSSPAAAVPGGSDRVNVEKGGGGGRCGAPRLRDGMQVLVAGTGEMGTVRFVGEVGFAAGTWLGLELRAPRGKHDGAVGGHRYFSCRPGCGVMVRPGRVSYRGINGARLLGEALLG